ncbi:hypothetical protein HCU64_01410 [Methylobacterium sp. C25]|uniref:hypothetical protein n=1 Tax=Methylobacterium sp. C25 TaxID=2721622 RepID=UPI001F240785|nr:hypothetical protein [Methylobacterium sp. C25]MCE4222396.1 hypothetical protein [Methylobacterium sp. C25]
MTARLASVLSALVVGIGMAGAPSFAQAETFQAWGHEFTVPGTSEATSSVTAPTRYTSMPADTVQDSRAGRHVSGMSHGTVRR